MNKAKTQLRFGVAFLILALAALLFSIGLVVFNQDGTGMNFGIIYTAFALIVFGTLGGSLTYEGWRNLRFLKRQQR
jgi:hypothetical protein